MRFILAGFARFAWLLLLLACFSCASYYRMNHRFNTHFENGEIDKAERILANSQKAPEGKARLLYYLNRGLVSSLQGEYEESNRFFEEAYTLGEDLRNDYWTTAASLLINPHFSVYTGEDHELLLLHYFKAINFLKMGMYENALVECRRVNIKLQEMSSHYQKGIFKKENRYTRDAFIHNLMGIVYEADQDYNNAFIAYRNAADIYREEYLPLFGIDVPPQLRKDLLRTAHIMGFENEKERYEKIFGMKYQHEPVQGGNLVFFWNNGLGPIKDQWSINFALIRGEGGVVNFRNEHLGFNFPFQLENEKEYEQKNLDDVEFIRVAFPKYVERPTVFHEATLSSRHGQRVRLEKAEDINGIAFRVLRQRMLKEFGMSLLRVAIKKGAEYGIREQNNDLGAVVSLLNAVTEQADTRNWQTIPHSIYYTRMSLPEGRQTVTLELKGLNSQSHDFTLDIQKGKTTFQTFHSLEADDQLYPF